MITASNKRIRKYAKRYAPRIPLDCSGICQFATNRDDIKLTFRMDGEGAK